MTALASRVLGLIEEAFDEDVKEIARAVVPKVAGGDTVVSAETGFKAMLGTLLEVRERQLADAAAVVAKSDIQNDAH